MPHHRYGASITLDGALAGLFLDGAHPEAAGDYGSMPVRSIGHYNLTVAVRSGRPPRCAWAGGGRSARFDVLAIPRYGVLSIGSVRLADDDAPGNSMLRPGQP